MERLMTQSINKELIYYGVYSTADDMWNGSDILCAARKRFFEAGMIRQKKRSAIKMDNTSYSYSYTMDSGTILKYKKTAGGTAVEHVIETQEGYYVETLGEHRKAVKRSYYNRQHKWLRTEYLNDKNVHLLLTPSEQTEIPSIVCKMESHTDVLYPFDVSLDKELTQRLNVMTSEPKVFCVTNCGSFYYCTKEELEIRKKALDTLIMQSQQKPAASVKPRAGRSAFVVHSETDDKTAVGFDLRSSKEIFIDDAKQTEPAAEDKQERLQTESDLTAAANADVKQADESSNVNTVSDKIQETSDEEKPEMPAEPTPETDKTEKTLAAKDEEKAEMPAEPTSETDKTERAPESTDEEKPVNPVTDKQDVEDQTEEQKPQPKATDTFFDELEHIAQAALEGKDTLDESKTDKPTEDISPAEECKENEHEHKSSEKQVKSNSEEAADPLNEDMFGVREDGAPSGCRLSGECPFEGADHKIIEADGRKYDYFGDLNGGKRSGRGRTVMPNGRTAYEGEYNNDQRDGFGVYYYRSGKLCYAGSWKENERDGLGAAFSPTDGSLIAGKWKGSAAEGTAAQFDQEGNLQYAGGFSEGQRNGAGFTYCIQDGTYFVGKYHSGKFLGTGTQFSSDGELLYTGSYRHHKRNGEGTAYNKNGEILYKGQWKDNVYHGEGTFHREDGSAICGSFKEGKADGICTLTDKNGKLLYSGEFSNGRYNGKGKLYLKDGGYAEGKFVNGTPTGIFSEYDAAQQLVYCGEWKNGQRSGRGIEYRSGQKVYEGEFSDRLYHGEGRLIENGTVCYQGTFVKGKRNGYGVAYEGNVMLYQGMWQNDLRHGCGILYENGIAKYVGHFENGKRSGRINEIEKRKVIRRSVFTDDSRTYTCEYREDGSLKYYGNMSGDLKNGMGCTFSEYTEKQFEGIFRNDNPEKAMKVFFKELPELPECPELAGTAYEKYRTAPEYVIEKVITSSDVSGIYSGRLKNGVPDGSGTMLYSDHRYTGSFKNGQPEGKGVLYMRDGEEKKGTFSLKAFEGSTVLEFADISYYYLPQDSLEQ